MSSSEKAKWIDLKPIDLSRRVQVYLNLRNGLWSIRQAGVIRAYTEAVLLRDAKFLVGAKGRERVLCERQKNVHAYVSGYLMARAELEELYRQFPGENSFFSYDTVTYNPYKYESFVTLPDKTPIYRCDICDMDTRDLDVGCGVLAISTKENK